MTINGSMETSKFNDVTDARLFTAMMRAANITANMT